MLAEFAEKQHLPYPLLSDLESEVIRRYGILNTNVDPGDGFYYGIPFPGAYVTDEAGVVVAKLFDDTYKKRDSAEILIDAALGWIDPDAEAPSASGGDAEIKVTAFLHGGRGTLRQGIRRHVVVRFELGNGLHIYGDPVPDGMVATSVKVSGPPGLVAEAPIQPPTAPFRLENLGVDLNVWSGTVDIVVPIYPTGELASEVRPLDRKSATIEVQVRYQACDDETCLLPRVETFSLEAPLDVVDVPAIAVHMGHGQREGDFDGTPHFKRLLKRKPATPKGKSA